VNYDREKEGDPESMLQQITPRAGGDSFIGEHDIEDRSVYGLGTATGAKNPCFDKAENDNSVFTIEDHFNRSKASYSVTNINHSKDISEVFHQRSEA
jgi:hypothetical protein